MCAYQYRTLKSTMKLPDPSTLSHLIPCDAGLEEAFGCQLINSGGQLVLASPTLLGFDQHCLLGSNGRALGIQPRPCIYRIKEHLAYAAFPQLTLIGKGFTYTVDFMLLVVTATSRSWSIHEVDGGGHRGEYDDKRLKDLQMPTFRYNSTQIHCTDFVAQFERQFLSRP